MIGTHDSATGEKGKGFLSWLVQPFSRTQDLTLNGQFRAGARYFDLRIALKDGKWYAAHGLWTSEKTFEELMQELDTAICNSRGYYRHERQSICVTVDVTLERNCKKHLKAFREFAANKLIDIQAGLNYVKFRLVSTKYNEKGDWELLLNLSPEYCRPCVHRFKNLRIGKWASLFPLPRFWDKRKPFAYDREVINMYDFLDDNKVEKVKEVNDGKIITWLDWL